MFQIIVPYYPFLIILTNTSFRASKFWNFVIANIVMCSTLYSMGAMCILFYFRYITLCLGENFSLKRQLGCLFLAGLGEVFLFIIHCYTYFNTTEDTVQYAGTFVSSFADDEGNVHVALVYKVVRFLSIL